MALRFTARFERASERLKSLAAYNSPLGTRIAAETEYGAAYQEMVRLGLAPPLRRKWRQI